MNQTVAKFIVPDWRDKVNSGVGCRTSTRLQTTEAGGWLGQPYAGINYIPSQLL
jgi:hypothetical protein